MEISRVIPKSVQIDQLVNMTTGEALNNNDLSWRSQQNNNPAMKKTDNTYKPTKGKSLK